MGLRVRWEVLELVTEILGKMRIGLLGLCVGNLGALSVGTSKPESLGPWHFETMKI